MSKPDGGMAFPGSRLVTVTCVGTGEQTHHEASYPGMTLRDWFAGQALSAYRVDWGSDDATHIARTCYEMADAMIEQATNGEDIRPSGGGE